MLLCVMGDSGGTVVKVLCYKVAGSIPAGLSGIFIYIKSFRSHYGPGVNSASDRNEYQEYFLGVKKQLVRKADNLTNILGHCHVIREP